MRRAFISLTRASKEPSLLVISQDLSIIQLCTSTLERKRSKFALESNEPLLAAQEQDISSATTHRLNP